MPFIGKPWDGKGPYAEFSHEGIRLAMYERKELPGLLGRKRGYPEGLNGTFELAINVGKPENVDRVYGEIIRKGGREVNRVEKRVIEAQAVAPLIRALFRKKCFGLQKL